MTTPDQSELEIDHEGGRTLVRPDGTLIRFQPPNHLGLAGRLPRITRETPPQQAQELLSHLNPDQQAQVLNYLGRNND